MKSLRSAAVVGVVVAVATSLAVVAVLAVRDQSFQQTIDRGNRVVHALEAFKVRHGEYPTGLDELVPEFVAAIPAPTWGTSEWHYEVRDGKFWLSAYANQREYPALYTNSSQSHWSYDH